MVDRWRARVGGEVEMLKHQVHRGADVGRRERCHVGGNHAFRQRQLFVEFHEIGARWRFAAGRGSVSLGQARHAADGGHFGKRLMRIRQAEPIEHTLRPFAVVMAGADVFDPFKD